MQLFDRTLGQWLEHWAEETPDKEYIVYSDRNLRFTWSQLNRRVDDMAKGLIAIGVERGTHVGIWAANVPDWLTLLYACAKIGAVYVTVNTNYKQSELEYLCQNSDMHTLCIVNGEKDSDFVQMTYTMLPELKTCERGHLKSERFPYMRNVVYVGQEKHRGMYNTAEILLLGNNVEDDCLSELKSKVDCHDVVNMQYTSGTTGFPKGVMLTHYNIANNGFLTGEHMKFTADDKLCCCVPLFHCFGVVLATMNCLTHGCTQVMVERFDPLIVLASIHKERCTALYGVPTMFIAELHHPMFDLFDMSCLRTGIMAGSLCPVELMKQVEEKMYMKVTSVYGLTETAPGMTASRIDDPFDVRCNTVGRDFEFTEVKVIDPETGEECPVGVQGEMCNRGYNTMKGYYKNPEATAEVLDENNFLHSGDLGIKDEDGNYRITGRIKDMIIRGGENIYPREIEEFLYKLDGVKDFQVAGIPSKKYGEAVGAFIILQEGVKMQEADVRDFCRNKISRYKIPKYIFFVNEFPMTVNYNFGYISYAYNSKTSAWVKAQAWNPVGKEFKIVLRNYADDCAISWNGAAPTLYYPGAAEQEDSIALSSIIVKDWDKNHVVLSKSNDYFDANAVKVNLLTGANDATVDEYYSATIKEAKTYGSGKDAIKVPAQIIFTSKVNKSQGNAVPTKLKVTITDKFGYTVSETIAPFTMSFQKP